MLYPHVTEVTRAGTTVEHMVPGQRELVALSLRLKPAPRTAKPFVAPRGIFR
jgi:hypothetical protein